nr:MAG TPA: hypothetical protein [Caudoviricetes sp.]
MPLLSQPGRCTPSYAPRFPSTPYPQSDAIDLASFQSQPSISSIKRHPAPCSPQPKHFHTPFSKSTLKDD